MLDIALLFFIFGLIFGSFYNVVASRITNGESIVFPPSHCGNCNHRLKTYELIPVFSYIFQKGKCKNCGIKLSIIYPLSELATGILFTIAFLIFGFSYETIIAITFISMLVIIILSDIHYMIIEDSVLLFFAIALLLEKYLIYGFDNFKTALLGGVLSFLMMYTVKIVGDFCFKKESLGGGDIKLMFVIGLMIGLDMSIISIVIASFLALPICLIYLKSENHEIPFGPFLGLGALIIYLGNLNMDMIINFFY